jgi:hypothetical protein
MHPDCAPAWKAGLSEKGSSTETSEQHSGGENLTGDDGDGHAGRKCCAIVRLGTVDDLWIGYRQRGNLEPAHTPHQILNGQLCL